MNTLTLETPGKINLYLEVKGKRPDGYHELLTLFYPVSLSDTVTLEFNDSGKISAECDVPRVPLDDSNLAVKAAKAYFAAIHQSCPGIRIILQKNLPVAGGMGGGSSDAGAVLRMLQQYTKNALSESELRKIALELGADVPFFLNPVPSLAGGRGELLEAVQFTRSLPILLLCSSFPVSAKWAYQHWNGTKHNPQSDVQQMIRALAESDFAEASKQLRNDLAPAVIQKFPILQQSSSLLAESGGQVLLSGSGPTLFALYPDFAARDQAYDSLQPVFQSKSLTLLKTC